MDQYKENEAYYLLDRMRFIWRFNILSAIHLGQVVQSCVKITQGIIVWNVNSDIKAW